uniref:Uncharacterized protein n=1 Tax=Lactuca sativa TaxID=4236 RepID=A0A9R1W8H2_LACSA|nr:hypothetical protein LSAT_V11C300150970 [Lactuca sativa]
MGRFLFDIEGIRLDFGVIEYILICGLKVGPYVDLLHYEKGQSNSQLRARLFPDISDSRFRLKDLEDLIMSPNYLALQDEDVVMLIQLVFMLKGLHGRDVKTGIPAAVYKLADNIDDWNSIISNHGTKNVENAGISVTKAQELPARCGQRVNPISCITSTSKTTLGTSDSQSLGNSMVYLLYPLMLIAVVYA